MYVQKSYDCCFLGNYFVSLAIGLSGSADYIFLFVCISVLLLPYAYRLALSPSALHDLDELDCGSFLSGLR